MFRQLREDIACVKSRDPAARSAMEILLLYPGLKAIRLHRLANKFYKKNMFFAARWLSQHASKKTGVEIHPAVEVGKRFFIDHGTGVVIGEPCVIGANVKLYQGVTLGAKSFPLDANGNPVKGIKRHPNLEDNVIIYAETTVLGDITIGEGSVIGANKWITQDVPPHSKIN